MASAQGPGGGDFQPPLAAAADQFPGGMQHPVTGRIWHIPARLAIHARQRTLKISPGWPWKEAFLACWHRLCALPAPA